MPACTHHINRGEEQLGSLGSHHEGAAPALLLPGLPAALRTSRYAPCTDGFHGAPSAPKFLSEWGAGLMAELCFELTSLPFSQGPGTEDDVLERGRGPGRASEKK